ncbi:hypothetical protein [Thalassotalea atypica]|uniref:hypothetical protein n=1 Tax=Thalassotalea atypica TaxID=2054316 RepID=UPI002574223B|nr:hypothetical protein [Thalassotalea atypica]
MKKFITTVCAIVLTSSFASHAVSNEELMDIDTYKAHLKEAMELYQSSDYDKALPKLEVFAQRGDKTSQYIVGTMYLNSQGTDQDLAKSYAWLTVANEQKSSQWKKPLQMLNDKLPQDYIKSVSFEAEKYVDLYGVKAQQMKCRTKKLLGSKKGTHLCQKSEIKPGYYYVSNPTYLVSK